MKAHVVGGTVFEKTGGQEPPLTVAVARTESPVLHADVLAHDAMPYELHALLHEPSL